MKNFLSFFAVNLAVSTATMLTVLLPVRMAIGQSTNVLKNAIKWQTLTNKEAGVSILMPPGTKVTPKELSDEKTGAKMVGFDAINQSPTALYAVMAVRLNNVALDLARKHIPAGQEPIDALYQEALKPEIDKIVKEVTKGAQSTHVSRKPLMWLGMSGEEITVVISPQPSDKIQTKGTFNFRMIKSKDSLFLVGAGESRKSVESDRRISQFFDSFTVSKDNPIQ